MGVEYIRHGVWGMQPYWNRSTVEGWVGVAYIRVLGMHVVVLVEGVGVGYTLCILVGM